MAHALRFLAADAVEKAGTGHPGMPEFEATPSQIADIVAYIGSIQAN